MTKEPKMTNESNENKQNKQVNPSMRNSNDEHLMTSYYKKHDRGGIVGPDDLVGNELMKRVKSVLEAVSYSVLGLKLPSEIEDQIQDVGLTVVTSAKQKKNRWNKAKSNLTTWLVSIYKHKNVDAFRKNKSHESKKESFKEHLKEIGRKSNISSPMADLIAGETYDKMLQTINNIKARRTTKNRLAFVLQCLAIDKLSAKEISEKGRMELGQVYRDKRKLIKILADFNPN